MCCCAYYCTDITSAGDQNTLIIAHIPYLKQSIQHSFLKYIYIFNISFPIISQLISHVELRPFATGPISFKCCLGLTSLEQEGPPWP